jgi:hypothetical protein
MIDRKPADRDSSAVQKQSVERLNRLVIRLIQIVAGLLAVAFAYLELQNAPLDRLTRAFDADSPTKLGLFLFFTSWFYGATHDTEIQAAVYKYDPGEGELGLKEFAGIGAFILFFAALFLLHERLVVFQLLLTVFIICNICTWRIILSRTSSIIARSAEHYRASRDNGGWAKLAVVVDYMDGRWQRRRFRLLFVLCLVQIAAAVLVATGVVTRLIGGVTINGVPGEALAAYLPGTLFVIFVIISSLWMSIYRIKVFSDLKTIDHLDHYFAINRQRGVEPPQISVKPLTDMSVTLNANYC